MKGLCIHFVVDMYPAMFLIALALVGFDLAAIEPVLDEPSEAATVSMAQPRAMQIDRAIEEIAPRPALEALERIDGRGRKLLALRSYLRAGNGLERRWSWSEKEIAAFQGSPEQAALLAEVADVAQDFADRNPGYTLYANTRVRSLDTQIMRWNENASVDKAAAELLADLGAILAGLVKGEGIEAERLAIWLRNYSPPTRASLAAPGLSRHGQAHAIDFQVMEKGRIIAPAEFATVETVWFEGGWASKLALSIANAGPSFRGPLKTPNEPWHYDYEPTANVPNRDAIDGKSQ